MDIYVVIHWHYAPQSPEDDRVYGIFHSKKAAQDWIQEAFPDEKDQRKLTVHPVESTAP